MRVALLHTFAASRKEPLAAALDRVHQAFVDTGQGEPTLQFTFSDSPLAGASSVDRVLKRHPELASFVTTAVPMPLIPGARRITNAVRSMKESSLESVPYATLHAIAAGVPRSFPFHAIALHFHAPGFGELLPSTSAHADRIAGVLLSDSWWVNGRIRSLSACCLVEADPSGKRLSDPPPAVAAILAACGKIKHTAQMPVVDPGQAAPPFAPPPVQLASIANVNPEAARAVREINLAYRARLPEILRQAALPHDLPPPGVALREFGPGVTAGPRKPALERAFKPLGYRITGGSGSFTIRRRTASHLTVELHLDVGTWGHSVAGFFRVLGLGFKATLILPVSAGAVFGGQYPIGDALRWQHIVENLAAIVTQLDRTFVPEIEAAAGQSPPWYQPES